MDREHVNMCFSMKRKCFKKAMVFRMIFLKQNTQTSTGFQKHWEGSTN